VARGAESSSWVGRAWAFVRTSGWQAIPLVLALAMVIHQYRAANFVHPDTRGFIHLAETWPRGSIWGGYREPVWATVLAGPIAVFGHGVAVARIAGVLAFFLLVGLVQFAALRFYGRAASLVAGMAIAASRFLAYWGVQGLREELAAAGVIGIGLLVVRGPTRRREWLVLAGLAGLLGMLRWDTLFLTLPVITTAMLLVRVGWRTILTSVALIGVIVSPLLIGNAVLNDDPLYHSNVHARFYRNLEFAGKPGFPTREEFARHSFAGPPVTWGEYLFGDHSLGEAARRAVKGPVESGLAIVSAALFSGSYVSDERPSAELPTLGVLRSPRSAIPWVLVLGAALGAVLMMRRGRWPFAVLLVLAAAQHFPVVVLPEYDFRLEITVYPLLVLANLEFAHWTIELLKDRWHRRIANDAATAHRTRVPNFTSPTRPPRTSGICEGAGLRSRLADS
jgi:hypothetical protein